ncbi:putative transcription factor C2C2-GATA family [Medicago truncatula]|uniref:GATA transcription factor n=2 Tax=Medicago truncatula TaxID=3880 RepID=A0A396HLT2_MEDTR|nr:putative transcription factor C2C2-GATA family [Medicago truncatula]
MPLSSLFCYIRMEALDSVDDLWGFLSDIGEDDYDKSRKAFPSVDLDDTNHSFSEFAVEDLEWLSNKDAFPAVETFVDFSCIQPDISQNQKIAPIVENSTSSSNSNNSSNSITLLSGYNHVKFPVRARSKSRSKPRLGISDTWNHQFAWKQPNNKTSKEQAKQTSTIGRQCHHCGADNTPLWRTGPGGPKTLCNACGVRYRSGRLVPEYRPAKSPTFCNNVHSNSHRKVVEIILSKPHLGISDTWNRQFTWKQPSNNTSKEQSKKTSTIGRKCHHCGADNTPQWRVGPDGPKTLCNACGVRYRSGRLVPEYRPANSPTFCSNVHSNSHRKVVEIRKQKRIRIG